MLGLFSSRGTITIFLLAVAALGFGCRELTFSERTEMTPEELIILQKLMEQHPEARVAAFYDSLKGIYPDARLIADGSVLILDTLAAVINGVELNRKRWIHTPGVEPLPGAEPAWWEERRKFFRALGHGPEIPPPAESFEDLEGATVRGGSVPGHVFRPGPRPTFGDTTSSPAKDW